MAAIHVDNLKKDFFVRLGGKGFSHLLKNLFAPEYKKVQAVKSVSFQVEAGERVAFIGPNGAGKSTTIKMLTGILHPSGGEARVAGYVPWKDRSKLAYKIGAVFGQRSQLWYHLPAADTFNLLRYIYDLEKSFYETRLKKLVDLFAIEDLLHKPVRQLSLGERMRCEIVASFLHKPEIIFLDEPTIGLDVVAKTLIRDLIKEQSEQEGSAVLLTSHDTGDMENVCDRVIVINHGELLLDQSVNQLRRTYIRKKMVTLHTERAAQVELLLPGVTLYSYQPHCTKVEVELGTTAIAEVVAAAIKKTMLQDLSVEDPPMEEIIKAIYAESGSA